MHRMECLSDFLCLQLKEVCGLGQITSIYKCFLKQKSQHKYSSEKDHSGKKGIYLHVLQKKLCKASAWDKRRQFGLLEAKCSATEIG